MTRAWTKAEIKDSRFLLRLVDYAHELNLGRGGNFVKGSQLRKLESALLRGLSTRRAAAIAGVTKVTATSYRKMLIETRGPIICRCGKDARHQGWCSYRISLSPKRRAFLRRWHQEQRRKHVSPDDAANCRGCAEGFPLAFGGTMHRKPGAVVLCWNSAFNRS